MVCRFIDIGIGMAIGTMVTLIAVRGFSGSHDVRRDRSSREGNDPLPAGSFTSRQEKDTATNAPPEPPGDTAQLDSRPEVSKRGDLEEVEPVLLTFVKPPESAAEKAQLLEMLFSGMDQERSDAVRRLGVALSRAGGRDSAILQAFETAIRTDPAPEIRRSLLWHFWINPDRFDVFVDRLRNDPSDSVKRRALELAGDMAREVKDEYATWLASGNRGERITRAELVKIAAQRRKQILEALKHLESPSSSLRPRIDSALHKLLASPE